LHPLTVRQFLRQRDDDVGTVLVTIAYGVPYPMP
jgi:hypothetical protein